MTEEPQNIQDFKEMVGRVLGALYASHPRAKYCDAESFLDHPVGSEEEDLFDDTIMYLVENGYLTQTDRNTHLRLNDRSYQVLQKPNPLLPQEPIGTTLARWAGTAASDAGKGVIAQAAGSALTLLYTIVANGAGG